MPCPDVVFLDLYLPRMDGIEIFAEIKHDPALRKIPVAVFSDAKWEQERFAAIDQVITYLTKSFRQEISRVETLLRQIQRRTERRRGGFGGDSHDPGLTPTPYVPSGARE
jgi:CheY-like chemotaxis protein